MRRKEMAALPANAHNSNSFTKNASRKHSALGLQDANTGEPRNTNRQFKPRFILKTKETPTNNGFTSHENSNSNENSSGRCYEYDDVHETFRKYEEEQKEMQRLKRINRQHRGNVLKLNMQYQLAKERNQELEREVQALRGGLQGNNIEIQRHPTITSQIPSQSQANRFASTISTITSILQQVHGSLTDRTSRRNTEPVARKVQKLLQCLHLYAQQQ